MGARDLRALREKAIAENTSILGGPDGGADLVA
jgi:hypothetical protein